MSQFPPLPFERMNEAAVREAILAPLIRELGYQTGTECDVIYEQSLRYPKHYLGHKKPTRDEDLRGKADYILEVSGHARWVLEAKAPGTKIDIDAVEQAYSYAIHPEVRAVYFALCNGRELQIFVTSSVPSVGALLTVPYEELAERFPQVANVVGPVAIRRDFPNKRDLVIQPLAPGMRGFARVASGTIVYQKSTVSARMLNEMQVAIVDGSVERDESGHLLAFLHTQAPLRSIQELNESLGLDSCEMTSSDTEISLDPNRPTEFVYSGANIIPEGTVLLDTTTWQNVTLSTAMRWEIVVRAAGFLKEQVFSGRFGQEMRSADDAFPPIILEGEFSIRLI